MQPSVRPDAVLWLILTGGHAVFGQTATGNILGRVTDATRAIVVDVAVTAFNPEKGSQVSNAQGSSASVRSSLPLEG
jgi:hypothetical protein